MTPLAMIKEYITQDNVRLRINEVKHLTQGYHEIDHSFESAFKLIDSPYNLFEDLKRSMKDKARIFKQNPIQVDKLEYNQIYQALCIAHYPQVSLFSGEALYNEICQYKKVLSQNLVDQNQHYKKLGFTKRKTFTTCDNLQKLLLSEEGDNVVTLDVLEYLAKACKCHMAIFNETKDTIIPTIFDVEDPLLYLIIYQIDGKVTNVQSFHDLSSMQSHKKQYCIHQYNLNSADLKKLKIVQLKLIARIMNVSAIGTKDTLISLIQQQLDNVQ